ncbi:MAG TPA: N,N-dimethylformamidase beta subunit family domain-containing protein [Planctomycetota bacterium]|nr:N,N-dimethylformamidase beta subunit family domain-containing protein [Planctomycetota bacterium]
MIGRRTFLQAAAAAAAAGCAPRRDENAQPGTTDWMLSKTRTDASRVRCPWIEGFASRTSVRAGETIEFKVSANPPSAFVLDLYRMGWYGGAGGRHVARLGPFKGVPQPEPAVGPERLITCPWETSASLVVPSDWPSGVYLGKLTEEREKLQSYVIFVVRDDRPCDLLVQVSDTTWAAYNRWPNVYSLYDDGTPPHAWYTGPGVAAGFDRPYGKYRQILDAPLSQGSGEFLLWEHPLAFWLEREGYDVSYVSNLDVHADPACLRRAKAFLSVGHDEYWSIEMFENVRKAVDDGLHAAFLCGNSVDGLIDVRGRGFSRVGKFGAFEHEIRRYGGRWTRHGPDPATLMGARSTFPYNGTADWTCAAPDHWLFEGTGMRAGDAVPGLVGWEHHGLPADLPGLEVVARGPVRSGGKPQGVDYTATIHRGPKGNWIFNAATIWWPEGLAAPPGHLRPSAHGGTAPLPDVRVQRITKNLLARFLT